ncbi:hypothetical protein [Labedaea rhizosphaerae]|uniref:hypothetical protein n=1 Tax=Labedaea rhizosphaerae TaxID=598644 RepID=UPI00105B74EC|nr:hypothetical protein [Labedaea rhizosphaerae]
MREQAWRAWWPIPNRRWPLAPMLALLTSPSGCLPTHSLGLPYGLAAHCITVMCVLVGFRLRTALRRRRQELELRDRHLSPAGR